MALVDIIDVQIERLDRDHDLMVLCSERLSRILYSQKIYQCYAAYHLLLNKFANSLIPITPF